MIIKPRTRGFICTTAHPAGCAQQVQEQVTYVLNQKGLQVPAMCSLSALQPVTGLLPELQQPSVLEQPL